SNADAIDQFELVLQTLGLNPDGEESSLLLADSDELEPTQTVENIVLEGDEVRQTEARVPGTPLDELDLFTRRLGVPTGADAAAPAQPPAQGVAAGTGNASRGAGLLAARRARLALAARRSAGGAEASVAAARAAGRDPGVAVGEPSELEGVDGAALAAGPTDLDIPGL